MACFASDMEGEDKLGAAMEKKLVLQALQARQRKSSSITYFRSKRTETLEALRATKVTMSAPPYSHPDIIYAGPRMAGMVVMMYPLPMVSDDHVCMQVYPYILIKVRMPDGAYLQARFHPGETSGVSCFLRSWGS